MKRYNVYENSDARESIDGAWVLHSDHEAAIQAAVAEFEQALAVASMLAEISDSKYESLMIHFRAARGAA